MKTLIKTLGLLTIILGAFVFVSSAYASTTDQLQPASSLVVEDELQVLGTARAYSVRIGAQGYGGVTFFNGTIINETTDADTGVEMPVTFGDDVRVDGSLWRGETAGVGLDDSRELTVNDDMIVSGDLSVGNLLGSDIVHFGNIATSNTGSTNQILSYNGSALEWVTVGTSSSDSGSSEDDSSSITVGDITSVTAGDGLSGGGTSGGVSLSVDDDLSITTLTTSGGIAVGGILSAPDGVRSGGSSGSTSLKWQVGSHTLTSAEALTSVFHMSFNLPGINSGNDETSIYGITCTGNDITFDNSYICNSRLMTDSFAFYTSTYSLSSGTIDVTFIVDSDWAEGDIFQAVVHYF